jgi:hypothetical protein
MNKIFEKPSQNILDGLFSRFRPYKLKENGENQEFYRPSEVNIYDLLIGLNFLSRYSLEKKLTILF